METPNGAKAIKRRMADMRRRAKRLFKRGYSYRQIKRELGYKSTASVAYLLK